MIRQPKAAMASVRHNTHYAESILLNKKKLHKSVFLHDDQLRNGIFLFKPELDDHGNLRYALGGVVSADTNNLALLGKAKKPIKVNLFPPFRPHGDGTPNETFCFWKGEVHCVFFIVCKD